MPSEAPESSFHPVVVLRDQLRDAGLKILCCDTREPLPSVSFSTSANNGLLFIASAFRERHANGLRLSVLIDDEEARVKVGFVSKDGELAGIQVVKDVLRRNGVKL